MQVGYHAEGQCQDDQIDHALKNPRHQPESVIVDAIPGIGVAVLPRPFQRNAIQEVGQCSPQPERYDYRFDDIYPYPKGPADGEDAVEEEQERYLGGTGDEKVQHGRRKRDLGVKDIGRSKDVVGVEITGSGRPRRGYTAC